jgi:Cu-processing system permease protein
MRFGLTLRMAQVVWRFGLSGRSAKLFLAVLVLVLSAAFLAALFSARQPATVALDIGLSAYKVLIVLLGVVWVQELVCRDMDRKSIFLPLSYPVSRSQYLLSRFLGILGLLALATLLVAVGVFLVTSNLASRFPQAVPVAGAGQISLVFLLLFLEQTIVLAFTMLIASLATVQALPMLLGITFAFVGRTIGAAVEFLTKVDVKSESVSPEIHRAVAWIELFVPDLGRFDLRGIALYGDPVSSVALWPLAGASLAYSAFFLLLACAFFSRRDLV